MPICTQDPGVCCASHLADLAPFPWCCAATTIQIMIFAPFVSYFWSNYSDLTWTHPKLWFSKGNLLISGKTALVKYYIVWPDTSCFNMFHQSPMVKSPGRDPGLCGWEALVRWDVGVFVFGGSNTMECYDKPWRMESNSFHPEWSHNHKTTDVFEVEIKCDHVACRWCLKWLLQF